FGVWVYRTFGQPLPDVVGSVLFWMFSAGALVFGTVLVVQRNPARGAIAFAFVILSTCGLFLLLAAPFLMAATIIIYAGAIIVTFLFVLMLSHAGGPSDENDRSREPLLGSLAGFGFVGLVLFSLYQTADAPTADLRTDTQAAAFRQQTDELLFETHQARGRLEDGLLSPQPDLTKARADVRKVRDAAVILAGAGDLPARNVANIGLVLYSDH